MRKTQPVRRVQAADDGQTLSFPTTRLRHLGSMRLTQLDSHHPARLVSDASGSFIYQYRRC